MANGRLKFRKKKKKPKDEYIKLTFLFKFKDMIIKVVKYQKLQMEFSFQNMIVEKIPNFKNITIKKRYIY